MRNAIARFNQTEFESKAAKERARKKIVRAAGKHDIEIDDDADVAHPVTSLAGDLDEVRPARRAEEGLRVGRLVRALHRGWTNIRTPPRSDRWQPSRMRSTSPCR